MIPLKYNVCFDVLVCASDHLVSVLSVTGLHRKVVTPHLNLCKSTISFKILFDVYISGSSLCLSLSLVFALALSLFQILQGPFYMPAEHRIEAKAGFKK